MCCLPMLAMKRRKKSDKYFVLIFSKKKKKSIGKKIIQSVFCYNCTLLHQTGSIIEYPTSILKKIIIKETDAFTYRSASIKLYNLCWIFLLGLEQKIWWSSISVPLFELLNFVIMKWIICMNIEEILQPEVNK